MSDEEDSEELEQWIAEMMEEDEELKALGFSRHYASDDSPVGRIVVSEPDNPTIKKHYTCELRKTSSTYISAALMLVGKADSDEVRHRKLTVQRYKRRGGGLPGYDFTTRIEEAKLEDAELDRLRGFLSLGEELDAEEYLVIPVEQEAQASVRSLIEAMDEDDVPIQEVSDLLGAIAGRGELLESLVEATPEDVSRSVGAGLRLAQRQKAFASLVEGMDAGKDEQYFQDLFGENWWMLGNRYVGRLERRDYTTDETHDIPLIRADGFAEIIELKRPDADVFKTVGGRIGLGAKVNDAVNQLATYISEVERQVDTLRVKYDVDFFKVRGQVVIGRLDLDGEEFEEKRAALQQYNSHLHRIEVVTYDHIAWRSQALIDLDERVAEGEEGSGDDS